jgi:predicted RNA-binding Zn-ribbon protein involved in translation (DUF1610 family)
MKPTKMFIYSAGGILLAAGLERFIVAAGDAQVLALPEPMLGIPLRTAVLAVGVLELAVALICLFGKRTGLQLGWLAWLATDYAAYWIGALAANCHPQGTCIGSLTDPLFLARGATGWITAGLPVYLLAGSYAGLIGLWLERRRAKTAQLLKMSCPACGVHIRFDPRNIGQKTRCPKCQADLTLRKADVLKMSCFFCKEHIEFPAHAIGQKLKCPHCNRDITLNEPTPS